LLNGSQVIPGAPSALDHLRRQGIQFRYMSNTSMYCRITMLERLRAFGFVVALDELYTATYVAADYLRKHNARSYYPLLLPDAQLEFAGIDINEETPEYIVIGDIGASFTFTRLNKAFRALQNGARLVALHKKRAWRTEEGLFLDAGAFVVALEYAAETKALVLGKPSADYFRIAIEDLKLPAKRIASLGDDIEADVRGAQLAGIQGWLVKTGRFRREDLQRGIWPDRVLENIQDLSG
jgi:HAD superfamily hydrolase (TIGR01458 family)